MAKAGRGSEQVMVRLPDGMRVRIKSRAEANNRSMNAEIVSLLEESLIDRMLQESADLEELRAKNAAAPVTTNVERHLAVIEAKLDQLLQEKGKK